MRLIKTFLITVLLVLGCKGKKSAVSSVPAAETPAAKSASLQAQELMQKVNKNWGYFSAKADVDVEGQGLQKSFNATIKMQKDSMVWVSVSLFGIEGLRVFMETDSITILNKLGRTYSRLGWEEISSYTGTALNLGQVQGLMIGNSLLTYDSNFKINPDSSLFFLERLLTASFYQIKLEQEQSVQTYGFYRGAKTGKYLSVYYSKHMSIAQQNWPGFIQIKAKDGENMFLANLVLENIDLNPFNKLPTTIPSSFNRE